MRSNPLRWLLLAGAIHITLTLAVFLAGHFQLLPNVFDPHGTGLRFAIDATSYRALSSQLATELQTNGVDAWLAIKAPLHCRLYSILFATVGRILGHNILAAEPLNLLYYLGILSCVYALGREIFNASTAKLAAVIVGIWPSFLMHSTQLIRDSVSILCLLALVLVLTLLLTRTLAWRSGLAAGIAGALLASLFWVLRGNMWNVVVFAVGLTIVLLLFRMIRSGAIMPANMIPIGCVLVAMLIVPSRLESTSLPGVRPPATPLTFPSTSASTSESTSREGIITRAFKQIGNRRAGFRMYEAQESNIDDDVRLLTPNQVLRFIPRAAVIGFFAPFPRMWFERGSYGSAGRLLSGAETFVMYFLYFGVAACVWRKRRRIETWLLFLLATLGTVALGLVVANAGALYRLRYVFWIMFIIMAANVIDASIIHFTVLRTNAMNSRMSSSDVSNDAINRHSDISSFQT